MATIPFFNRQVAPQTQSMPRGSMQAAGAVWDAVAGAGQQIANLGEKGMSLAAQIQKKKQEQTDSLLEAKYKQSLVEQATVIESFRAKEMAEKREVTPESISAINTEYRGKRQDFISQMSGNRKDLYEQEFGFDEAQIDAKTKIFFDKQTIEKNTVEFKTKYNDLIRAGKEQEAEELLSGAAWLGEKEIIETREGGKRALRVSNYNASMDMPYHIETAYVEGSASYTDSIAALEAEKESLKTKDLDAGQRGNVEKQIASTERRLATKRIEKHRTAKSEAMKEIDLGKSYDAPQIQYMLDSDQIDELGAREIATKMWQKDSGVPTTQNNAIYGMVTSDIKNGRITSFDDLESKKFEMTPTQYDQAERELADKIGFAAFDANNMITTLSGKTATVATLQQELQKIQKKKIPESAKEALTIIAENSFSINKNPELAEGYVSAVSDIMQLERYLGMSPGYAAQRLVVLKDMDVKALKEKAAELKSLYDSRVQDKIKENLRKFDFKRTVAPPQPALIDDVLNEVFGDE